MPGKISPAENKENPRLRPYANRRKPDQNKPEKPFLQKPIYLWYALWSPPKKQKKKDRRISMI